MSSPKRMKITDSTGGVVVNKKVLKQPRNDVENMSREELIHAVTFYKNHYGQLKNRLTETSSKLNRMTVRLDNIRKMSEKKKKKRKEIDFTTENYRRVALKFSYFGWDYEGLQENPNLDDTIEKLIREAIRGTKLAKGAISFTRCGRTDKGVSAFSQVITVKLRTKMTSGPEVCGYDDLLFFEDLKREEIEKNIESKKDLISNTNETKNTSPAKMDCASIDKEDTNDCQEEFEYVTMLNRVLPPEIRILAWAPVGMKFSARFNCVGREYRYFFPMGKLNLDRMDTAAKRFTGLHDFRNFGKVNVLNCMNYVRRINEFNVKLCDNTGNPQPHDMCYAQIKGSGFVYHQVRSMMMMLFLVGMGHENCDVITQLLDVEKNPCKPAFGLAPPYPLVLYDCKYDDIKWRVHSHSALSTLIHLQSYWTELAVKAQMAKECAVMCQSNDDIRTVEPDTSRGKFDQYTGCTPREISRSHDLNSTLHSVHTKFISDCHAVEKDRYKPILERPTGISIAQQLSNAEERKIRLQKRHERSNSDDFVNSNQAADSNL